MPMDDQTADALKALATSISQLQQGVASLREKVDRLEDRLDDRGRDDRDHDRDRG